MPPAITISLSPSETACAASADGLESRAANFIDGHGGDADVQAATQRRLPRGILPQPRLHDIAHDDFIDRFRSNAGAAGAFRNNLGAQLGSGKRRQATLKFTHRSPHGADNHGSSDGA